jgi:uncharacterized protein YqjF (DUF2071 family)
MKALTLNKWVLLLVIFLVLSNLALVFFAFSNSAEKKNHQEDWMKKELGLSDEQSRVFKEKKEAFMTTMKPRWEQVNLLKDSLYKHLGDEQVPDSLVYYYTSRWMEKTRENDQLIFHHFRDLRKSCKKEQLLKYDTVVAKIVTRRYKK